LWCGGTVATFKGRLRGAHVTFEVDNLVTKWCLKKASSRSKVLNEMVKRIWFLCMQHGVKLTVLHLAGELNVRPDGLSRGCQPSSPNICLKQKWVSYIQASLPKWKFDLCVGRENDWLGLPEVSTNETLVSKTALLHPRFDCIGDCLWWVFEAVTKDPWNTKGIIILPYKPDAIWWPLIHKFVVFRVLPAATFPLSGCKHDGSKYDLTLKYDLLLCMFPIALGRTPVVANPETIVTPEKEPEGRPSPTRTLSEPSPPSAGQYGDNYEDEYEDDEDTEEPIKKGSILLQVFNMEEREMYGVTRVTNSGRKVRQYGWVYEVMAMDEENGDALCRWWAKALPSGKYERECTFVLTEDAENAVHDPLEKSWYAIPIGNPEATLLDVSIVSEIKWIGSDPTKARLTLDPRDALFNFVGNARCGDIDIINEEECEAANPWRALLNTLWFMKWPMEPEYFSIGGGEILSPETKRRCGSQLRHVLDYSNNAQMYREFATKHGWSHREATFAADTDWYTFAKLIKTVSRIKDYQGAYMENDCNRLCPPGTHHGVTSNLLV
jgi:hypothetical protein